MNKKIINTAGCILMIISFVFLLRRVAAMDVDWERLVDPAIIILLITMPFLNVTVIGLNAFCWGRSLALFSQSPVSNSDVFAVYAKSNLAKYLPGNVGHYAARQMFASQIGLRQVHIALASVFEIGYSSCSMLAVSALFSWDMLAKTVRMQFGDGVLFWVCGAVVAVAGLFMAGYFLRRSKYAVEVRVLAARPQFWLTMLGSLLLFAVSTFFVGSVFVLIMCQYAAVDIEGIFMLIGGCTASYLIGFITPGVPGGIGVREAAMLFLLEPFFPGNQILLAAVVQRLTMIIGDMIVFPISRLFQTDR